VSSDYSVDEVFALRQRDEIQLIDVRQLDEHAAGRIADTRLIELSDLAAQAETIDRERPVVFYCRSGSRSAMAADAFSAAGYDAHGIGDDLLAQFDLTEAAHRPISQFSGGMRRRLDLAASLITRPALIFLDEPTTGLDPRNRSQMWDTIRDLVAEGSTIMLTTQYLDEADALADRVVVIDRGRKVAEGTPSQLKAQIGTSSLRVQMAEGADTANAVALAADVTSNTPIVSPTGSAFSVQLSHANQAADVLIELRNHRLDITSATVEQPSLDEVFFALTGHTSEASVPETEASGS